MLSSFFKIDLINAGSKLQLLKILITETWGNKMVSKIYRSLVENIPLEK